MNIPFLKFLQPKPASQWRLAVSAFVIGAGVMAVELTASRLLAPYFGASMYVWTSLIVTVLIALSFGYYFGGKAAEKNLGLEVVGFLAMLSGSMLVLGLQVIPKFSSALSGLLAGVSSATLFLFLGSLVVTLVVFALPLFLMGMAAPILLKEWSKSGDVGAVAGRYFAVSTGGSVVGTVAPSLVLVPWIGARATMFAVTYCFLGLAFLLLPLRRRLVLLVTAGITVIMLLTPATPPKDVVFERESPYQLIRVSQQEDGSRFLIFNEGSGIQSMYVPQGGRTGFYFDFAGAFPLLVPSADDGSRHEALIVGLAGGTVASKYRQFSSERDIGITGVEVDQAVIDTARKYFELDAAKVDAVNYDGRMFFRTTDKTFDFILTDAYSTQLYIPPHLATVEYFALAKTRLKPNGVFSINVNAPTSDSPLLKALANSVAASYKHVVIVPTGLSWNHLVFASDEPIRLAEAAAQVPADHAFVADALHNGIPVTYDPNAPYFTDDHAPIEHLTDKMVFAEMFKTKR